MKSVSLSMGSYNFEPLQITAVLRTAVVADEWLPLDGILLYQKLRELLGFREMTMPGAPNFSLSRAEAEILPIKIIDGNKEWYYSCSWVEWGPYVDGMDYWNKRYDTSLSDFVVFKGRGVVNTSEGQFKAYHQPIFYRSALWARWYCVGDRAEIARLLSFCTHVGKKTVQGWGRVARWEVEPIEEDWSIWKDGKLMRGIPVLDVPADYVGNIALYGVRPPYWDKQNQIMIVLPQR